MIEPRTPVYRRGQKVWTQTDLYNDGTFPEREPDDLLRSAGSVGEIVRIGVHEETNTPVYLVQFSDGSVLGCFEEELRAERERTPRAGDPGVL
jgi:nitrogen fixation protein NifZ